MKNVRIYCWLLLLPFLPQTAKAYLDIPLNWKIQEWQFVVIAQAGEQRTNNEGVYVEKKVVKILRGNETDLPKFEWWQNNDIKNGQYYLLTYQFPRWEQRFDVEATNSTFVIKPIQDNQTHGFYNEGLGISYRDLSLNEFQNLLENIPYESNFTNTFLYKYAHRKKPILLTKDQAETLALRLADEKVEEERGGNAMYPHYPIFENNTNIAIVVVKKSDGQTIRYEMVGHAAGNLKTQIQSHFEDSCWVVNLFTCDLKDDYTATVKILADGSTNSVNLKREGGLH